MDIVVNALKRGQKEGSDVQFMVRTGDNDFLGIYEITETIPKIEEKEIREWIKALSRIALRVIRADRKGFWTSFLLTPDFRHNQIHLMAEFEPLPTTRAFRDMTRIEHVLDLSGNIVKTKVVECFACNWAGRDLTKFIAHCSKCNERLLLADISH